jgi:hypothetical protein
VTTNEGFEVIPAVEVFFWDIKLCSPLKSTDVSEDNVAHCSGATRSSKRPLFYGDS